MYWHISKHFILLVVLGSLTLLSVACEDSLQETDNDTDQGETVAFDEVESPGDFEAAQDVVGNAEGDAWSGDYRVESEGYRYSDDCTAEFVLAHDFYIDSTLSENEAEDVLESGGEAESMILTIVQNDGSLEFMEFSDDDGALEGAINEDGAFQALFGEVLDDDNYGWIVYDGSFHSSANGATFQATMTATLHLEDDDEANGSCTVTMQMTGERL